MRELLSVCMIVRDEEHLLPTCLTSAQALSDDIAIVDTGSQDRSIAVARAYGARVVERAWLHDFAQARNESLKLVQRPWVCVLDADEQVSPEAVAAVHAHIAEPQVGALTLSIHDPQPSGAVRISHVLRAWRHSSDIAYRHRIHEDVSWAVLPRLRKEHQRLVHIAAPVFHVGYGDGESRRKSKKERDAALLNHCVADDPSDLYSWFKLLELGNVWADGPLTRRAAARARTLMRSRAAANMEHYLGDLVLHLEREAQERGVPAPQRLHWLRHWGRQAPREPTLATLEGQLCELLGDAAAAHAAFERALGGDALRPNVQMRQVRPTLGLARLAVARGELSEGLALARSALALAPEDREAQLAIAGLERLCG